MRKLFVTGIGTGIGKTVVSAIITEALQADYWKPVQAGYADGTDSLTVKKLISNQLTVIHPEAYCLAMPASPHAAAEAEGITLEIKNIKAPVTTNNLVIEGAGGLMVPLSTKELVIDLIQHLKAEVVLVSRHYLGSINHTLLSLEALKQRNIPVSGIVFIGNNPQSEKGINAFYPLPIIGRMQEEKSIDAAVVTRYAKEFSATLSHVKAK